MRSIFIAFLFSAFSAMLLTELGHSLTIRRLLSKSVGIDMPISVTLGATDQFLSAISQPAEIHNQLLFPRLRIRRQIKCDHPQENRAVSRFGKFLSANLVSELTCFDVSKISENSEFFGNISTSELEIKGDVIIRGYLEAQALNLKAASPQCIFILGDLLTEQISSEANSAVTIILIDGAFRDNPSFPENMAIYSPSKLYRGAAWSPSNCLSSEAWLSGDIS